MTVKHLSRVALTSAALLLTATTFPTAQAAIPGSEERANRIELGLDEGPAAMAGYIMELQDAPLARYRGGVPGLNATSTRVTGAAKLDPVSADSVAYLDYLATQHAQVLASVNALLGRQVDVAAHYRAAYNGIAVWISNAEAGILAGIPGVKAMHKEQLRKLNTDVGPTWIGAPSIYDGSATPTGLPSAGEGMIIGVIDSGVNTDHPSFAEVGPVDGHVHINPLADGDPLTPDYRGLCDGTTGLPYCNDKLIGVYDCTQSVSGTRAPAANTRAPDPRTATGFYGPTACGRADQNPFTFSQPGGVSIDIVINDSLGQDLTFALYYDDPTLGEVLVLEHDFLLGTETASYTPPGGVPTGDYHFEVCPFSPLLVESQYVATLTWNDVGGTGTGGGCTVGSSPEDFNGHGSHTASTSAGNLVSASIETPTVTIGRSLSGVARHANLITYLGCVPSGNCVTFNTVAGIEQATLDLVDAINYSIGGGPSNPWSDTDAVAFRGAREAGIWVATSASNDGPGAGSIGSPADAPWVTTVGASTHNRLFANSLSSMSGGDTPPPADIVGKALTSGHGPATILYAGDIPPNADLSADPALCAGGDAQAATNPWAPTTFNGEIVVCDRGTFARVDKCSNVCEAGAGGCVLANDPASADSLVADPHACPSVHISHADGVVLKNWLATGTGHTGTIPGTVADEAALNGDIQAGFSSRGPNSSAENNLKPDVTNPGVDILAAVSTYTTGGGNPAGPAEYGLISGTSMSSPHTAGSLALLKSVRPEFTPAEGQSALMLTSSRALTRDSNGTDIADPFDRGAGRVDLSRAALTGLVLDEPNYGTNSGDAKGLNIPSMSDVDCSSTCTWTRTVKSAADVPVTWTASLSSLDYVKGTITPAQFTLAPGGTQVLTITADIAIADHVSPQGNPGPTTENETQDTDAPLLPTDPVEIVYRACNSPAGRSFDCWVFADVELASSVADFPDVHMPLAARSTGDADGDGTKDLADVCPLSTDPTDADNDGVPDACDNCLGVSNASQCDTDRDFIGNHCDGDFNQDGFTNQSDLGTFRGEFRSPSTDSNADLNCDGFVNQIDLGIFRNLFRNPPGPSAIAP